ncbi:disease resistance protein RGA2-like [Triticum dicoccoides]|uniref:disease resistance protein RGA2-like n=1 Tax=Triticum dicoccoides TaxID=85692 RepID=UPI0018912DF7|nr:disease resistance protein RGA2-like [Triticum dicoccoides]
MEAAIGAARGLVGRVVNLLSNDLVQAYVASAELGLSSEKTKDDLMRTQVVLREAQRRGVINNPSLEELLHKLHTKVGKAEDALDELQYFIIQDQLDGTQYAVPDLGNTLWGHARHIRHAIHHAIGNFILPCFSCWLLQDDDHGAAAINHPHNTSNPASGNDGSVTKLSFDRVAMSKKIKQAIEEMHSLCDQFLELLKIIPDHSNSTTTVNLKRPLTGSITAQDKLYGREDLFEQTIKDLITNCTDSNKALSVMPIIGPGGIGKTTFTQHLYKDKRTREHYPARAWICVSTDFDVLKLSQQILSQIEENNDAYQTSSLNQLQNSIEKGLKSKRFLIVFDDIWECTTQDWETLLAPMGKGETTGNMVLVTTRFPSKVDDVKTTDPILLKGLELDDFLTFFEALIFEGQIPHNENYMEELLKNGFLVKENDRWSNQQYYVLHDLLHELARSVSSQECLNIYSNGSFRADDVPKSIRHLSITMKDKYVETFRTEMTKLKSKVDIPNLRALMIFRKYEEQIDEIIEDTFKEIEALRVLFIEVMSPESLPHYFPKLIHLRYLKISPSEFGSEVTFPSTLSRFYHLQLLDLSDWYDQSVKLPNDINRLTNLCHFIAEREVHSNVPEVGKMKYLKELKEFHVKKESVGFELSELGDLTELGGELSIYNIGNVATKEEAMKAKLVSKGDLETLRLVWGGLDASEPSDELSDVLDGLEPHPNLQSLGIENHGGSVGPHWLCGHMSIKMLVSLHLEGVSWAILPPFGQLLHLRSLKLINISSLVQIKPGVVGVTAKSFTQLKEIVLDSLSEFTQWDEAPNAHSFSMLEKIVCKECPNLYALPFLQDCSMGSYNHLWKLEITGCPKLPMPLMPHTSTLTDVTVDTRRTGRMVYVNHNLYLTRYNRALAWHNMAGKVESITFKAGSTVPWIILQSLTSFKTLVIEGDSSKQSLASLSYLTSLTNLRIQDCKNFKVGGFNLLMASNLKDLAVHNIIEYYPRSVAADLLSELAVEITRSKKLLPPTAGSLLQLVRLNVDSISAVLVAPVCRLLAATLKELVITCDREVENLTKDEEKALQLLTSLQELSFWRCHRLRSFPQGLHGLPSLRKLQAITCRRIRSLPKKGIPTSLRELSINDCSRKLHNQAKKLNQRNLSVSA